MSFRIIKLTFLRRGLNGYFPLLCSCDGASISPDKLNCVNGLSLCDCFIRMRRELYRFSVVNAPFTYQKIQWKSN